MAAPAMNIKEGWTRSQARRPCQGWWENWIKKPWRGVFSVFFMRWSQRPADSSARRTMMRPRMKSSDNKRGGRGGVVRAMFKYKKIWRNQIWLAYLLCNEDSN